MNDKSNDGLNVLKHRSKFTKKNAKHNGSILLQENEKRNDSAHKLGGVNTTTH